jgi:hypothetical protein
MIFALRVRVGRGWVPGASPAISVRTLRLTNKEVLGTPYVAIQKIFEAMAAHKD